LHLQQQQQLFHWHVANLEFANAARAGELSLRHWAQDDPYELLGAHVFTTGGNSRLVQLLTRDLPIFYRCPVAEIRYGHSAATANGAGGGGNGGGGGSSGGVTVVTEGGAVFEATAAVVTLPLGVLKADAVRFEPPLPPAKQEAIRRLGYGRLNKVALLFPHVFWDASVDTFACVMSDKERRGSSFLFYCGAHTSGGAVLTALVAGTAAIAIESMSDEAAVAEVMRVLRNIFDNKPPQQGPQQQHHGQQQGQQQRGGGEERRQGGGAGGGHQRVVPDPLQAFVTRWGADPYSRGSYSSMAVSCRGAAEYEAMAAPVAGRLFFAGEATIHKYPATMHGAMLSGLREAGRIHYAFARARHGLPPREDDLLTTTAAPASLEPPAPAPPAPLPPPAPSLAHVRRLHCLGAGLRGLFGRCEPDLEFGCFRALFGPQEPGQQQWAVLQIDLGCIRSRSKVTATGGGGGGRTATAAASAAAAATTATPSSVSLSASESGGDAAAAAAAAAVAGGGPHPHKHPHHQPHPYPHPQQQQRWRAVVHLPLPRATVEQLWCMRGGDDARLLALSSRLAAATQNTG
ncbi:hypothetical protein Agub_g8959, partial [Astrephomene gubernaculifera]